LRGNGTISAWGGNDAGQLAVPSLPAGLAYVQVAAGASFSMARRSDGSVVVWGDNSFGQTNVPVLPAGVTYVDISAGFRQCLGRTSAGGVVVWGQTSFNQQIVPSLPVGYEYVAIAAAFDHSIALARPPRAAPTAYCTAQSSSSGCVPTMSSNGTPSLSFANAFSVVCNQLEAGRSGIQLFGTSGAASLPFSNGLLCVNPPFYRLSVKRTQGTAACSGSLTYSMSEMLNAQGAPTVLSPGAVVHQQTWIRDPAAPVATAVSNGLTYVVCP
jgi:hypothetical protein